MLSLSLRVNKEHSERLRYDHDIPADLACELRLPADFIECCRFGFQETDRRRESTVDVVYLEGYLQQRTAERGTLNGLTMAKNM